MDDSDFKPSSPPQPPTFFPVIEEEDQRTRFTQVAVLVLLSDPKKSKDESTFRLNKERIVIGSVESADIRLSGKDVSPIHTVIELSDSQGGGFKASFYDLASESGTFHNGQREVSGELRQNDKLKIGGSEFKFFVEAVSTATKASSSIKNQEGRALFIDPEIRVGELVLQTAEGVEEIFDYSGVKKGALEVVMSWHGTILEVGHFNKSSVTVGASRRSDFVIPPILKTNRFPVVNRVGGEFVINVDSRMLGVVQKEGKLLDINDLRRNQDVSKRTFQVPIGRKDFAKLSLGDIHFYISFTPAPPRLKKRRVMEKDLFFFKVFWSSILLNLAILLALFQIETPPLEEEELPDRIATIIYSPEKYSDFYRPVTKSKIKVPDVEKKTPDRPQHTKIDLSKVDETPPNPGKTVDVSQKTQAGAEQARDRGAEVVGPRSVEEGREGEGAKQRGEEGSRGSTKSKNEANVSLAMRPSTHGGPGRGGTKSQVPDLGNLEALKGAAGTIKDLLSGTTSKLGTDGKRLQGIGGFEGSGYGGSALSGTARGGGGTADSLGLSKRGRGAGKVGTGPGAVGTGANLIGAKQRVAINLGSPYDAVVMGAIDANAVLEAIRRHADEFRLCYENELNAYQPKLAGRVGTNFIIGKRGRVTKAGVVSTSLQNPRVERCVLRVLKRIQFPIPRGGGTVEVTIPFKFRIGAAGV